MKFNDRYDTDDIFAWYDDDPQDGTYFREQESPRDTYDENAPFGDDRDYKHEQRKRRAALYIHIHKELLKDADYLKTYNKILDEYAREYAYNVLKKPISIVSDEERELESSTLDFQIACLGKRKVERYKDDAVYIVDWVKSGKNLIVYI